MNLRTPRRRISPRTIRRYRAIKNFVRRALGSSSQPDIRSNSSICVSVLDLRQKIHGIEQELNTVSKHCQDLASLKSNLKLKDNIDSEKDTDTDTKEDKTLKTEVLYKTSNDRCHKPVKINKNKSTPNVCNDEATTLVPQNKMLDQNYSYNYKENQKSKLYRRLDPIQESEQTQRSHKNNTASRTLPAGFPKNSFQSFNEPRHYHRHPDVGYSEIHRQRKRKKIEYLETNDGFEKVNLEHRFGDHKNKNHRNKYLRPDLDQDFIAEIIKRQYRPVKLFGRRESDFSQISAPVCRDQEFSLRETVQQGSDLCSCCHKEHKRHRHSRYMCNNDLSDVRSICDTRLYSSKKHKRHTSCRKRADDFYNDSTMYDVIPVKEKSSPKSRRKFVEDLRLMQDKYREVPPSPRTQRPRLNLQTQYLAEDDDDVGIPFDKQQLRHKKRLQRTCLIQNEENISNISSEVFIHNRNFKRIHAQYPNNPKPYNEECTGTLSNLQFPLTHDQAVINNDTTLNTQTTDLSADKTDKALSEIKDILQSFLQEIKKESSQSEKLNSSAQASALQNVTETQNQSNSFNNNNLGHCSMPPFMQSFPNSCCYPILPICPMNCMQNGYVIPSPSFTCAACANNSKERTCGSNDFKNKINSSEDASCETQKLIKEIHNLISQNPNSMQKNEFCNDNRQKAANNNADTKILTSRSVGGSSKASKHDAKVGTTKMSSHSKSCEAIGSRVATDTRYAANVRYSDTVLERGSGEEVITESVSESEYTSESTVIDKKKGNKFTKILRSIGILKRNKKDVIEELSESDSSLEIQKPNQRPPFQQHIINYNMHGQEYFNPHINPHNQLHQQQYKCYGYPPHYDPKTCYSPTYMDNKTKKSQGRHLLEQNIMPHCTSPHHIPVPPCASYYDPHYLNGSPQVPVCLKEIEVKSIGTQSVRKISLLQKLTNKIQVPVQQTKESSPKQSSTRTLKDKNTNNLFDWKKIHEKAMQKTTDPLKFSYKTQKRLAEGDNTMRNAMLKKLFYKRNPFSPRNLLVRTLLGKDKSSFGDPPKMYKPKMFL